MVGSHVGAYIIDGDSLVWTVPLVAPANKSGSLEFTIDGEDASAFFPVTVDFTAEGSLIGIGIEKVMTADGAEDVVYSQEITCTAEDYTVV